jgi:hypothetical protein
MNDWYVLVDHEVVALRPAKQIAPARAQVGQQCTLCPAQCSERSSREGSLVGCQPMKTAKLASPVGQSPAPKGTRYECIRTR